MKRPKGGHCQNNPLTKLSNLQLTIFRFRLFVKCTELICAVKLELGGRGLDYQEEKGTGYKIKKWTEEDVYLPSSSAMLVFFFSHLSAPQIFFGEFPTLGQ